MTVSIKELKRGYLLINKIEWMLLKVILDQLNYRKRQKAMTIGCQINDNPSKMF